MVFAGKKTVRTGGAHNSPQFTSSPVIPCQSAMALHTSPPFHFVRGNASHRRARLILAAAARKFSAVHIENISLLVIFIRHGYPKLGLSGSAAMT